MNLVNAEITKLSVNTFVTMKISFANMIAGICERMQGADVDIVTSALGLDSRIGHRYLKGALGYGGPCFPRDNLALTFLASALGAPAELASATDALNRDQVPHLVEVVRSRLAPSDAVAVLGLSYKPGTDVVEESQGLLLARALLDLGEKVIVFDPVAMSNARSILDDALFASSAEEAVSQAGVVVIATPWPEFTDLALDGLSMRSGKQVLIDCWRMLDRSSLGESVEYVALGVGE
jgi:UDPglucose 6-dehydrogenase